MKSGGEGIAGDPLLESLCFKRRRAMEAKHPETLDGDEASRLRTNARSLVTRRVSARAHAGVCGKGRKSALFRVGVGDERVKHEIAIEQQNVRKVDRV